MKTYSKDKQAFANDFFSNTPNLSQGQKEYESKLWPKHYKPELSDKRLKNFEASFSEDYKQTGLSPKKESTLKIDTRGSDLTRKTPTPQLDRFKPLEGEIFVVSSFNDWMPTRMKTLRTLNLERY